MTNNNWFATWFDSPYYPILYKNRDLKESEEFIEKLLKHLQPTEGASFLDLACGRGRHSVFINKKGYKVVGLDLSPKSIKDAKQYENSALTFGVHDMREPIAKSYGSFSYVFNLFTSFGYFNSLEENLNVLKNISQSLSPKGKIVIDFLNTNFVFDNLKESEVVLRDKLKFNINREVKNGIIYKNINFEDKGNSFSFTEEVQALTIQDFETLFNKAGLKCVERFGNYQLEELNNSSDRLIMVIERL